ncbi:MAG: TonB-dependent receptor [Bacteroidota bacterium]|nr:TonB-dependent receptor [Candidatus Kapabacteria bacterium]MDW8220141.1 TonB-dependent receptor [Bacteroidota bacterium]
MNKLILALTLLFAYTTSVFAQGVTSGALSGSVTTKDGKPLAGARVVATHEPSGTKYGGVAGPTGRYNIPGMRTGGPYTVQISSVGMKAEKFSDVMIRLGETFILNATLEEGEVRLSEITVTSKKNAVMGSERTGAATNISKAVIETLPTLSRSTQDFTRLTPQANGLSFAGQDPRFINFTIDGSIYNNSFGLASLPGGQTNATPISLDAIEEFQVNLAPFDVRQGGFVGAGINAVTRKGDNQLRFSAFYNLRNQTFLGDSVQGTDGSRTAVLQPGTTFSIAQYGFRLGGPIVQDKLFFFVNGEVENRVDPGTLFVASSAQTPTGANVVRPGINLADSLDRLRRFLIDTYQYDPGEYQGYSLVSFSAKATARFDYNIDENQKVFLRFNYLRSFRDVPMSSSGGVNGRNGNLFAMNFSNSNYRINNDIYSAVLEYNGTFGGEWYINVLGGFTANRDYRELFGSKRFPTVDILLGGRNVTSFGDEPFTPNNLLNTDTWQAQVNATRYIGDHTITAGANFESFAFQNGFTPNISGLYQFLSFSDFYAAAAGRNVRTQRYQLWFSALEGGRIPIAETRSTQIGFYLQDEWNITPTFRLTLGVRADVPSFAPTALNNPEMPNFSFGGERFNTSQLPQTTVLWSPRLGFNWDVTGERTTQVRGGAGIFSGRVPFVIISNQVSNTGMFNGLYNISGAVLNQTLIPGTQQPIRWDPSVTANIPPNASAAVPPASYNIAISNPNFRFPQVFRANIAVDQELPGGIIATLEGIYSQNINAVLYRNANLPNPTANFSGPDNRPRYPGSFRQSATGAFTPAVDSANRYVFKITDVIVLDNTNQGNSFALTAQVRRDFDFGLNLMTAYTYSESRDLSSFGSIAFSSWRDARSIRGNNFLDLSFSDNDMTHRAIASVSYGLNWSRTLDLPKEVGITRLTFFVQAQSQNRITYTVNGDLNGDAIAGNDLMFVPADPSQINFVPLTVGGRTFDAAAQWAALNAYIEQDPYLRTRRGMYAERNGGTRPILTRIDMSLTHDFQVGITEERPLRLQARLDIFNVTNMLNRSWGVADALAQTAPLEFQGVVNNQPRYRLSGATIVDGNLTLPGTLRSSAQISDVWQMQFGVRVTFD